MFNLLIMFSFLVTLQRYEIIVIPQLKLTNLAQLFLFVKNVNLLLNLTFYLYLYDRKNNARIKINVRIHTKKSYPFWVALFYRSTSFIVRCVLCTLLYFAIAFANTLSYWYRSHVRLRYEIFVSVNPSTLQVWQKPLRVSVV